MLLHRVLKSSRLTLWILVFNNEGENMQGDFINYKYKLHGVRTRTHFFGSKSKKTKRFMIFDPKEGGGHFLTPPPPSIFELCRVKSCNSRAFVF